MSTVVGSARFGFSISNRSVVFGAPVADLISEAEAAEASGFFDSVWVGDNFLTKPRLEAIVNLAAIAARTQHVRLGTACFATFVMRHPVQLAIQWASLDLLSGGRTILAVCNGLFAKLSPRHAAEAAAMGVADEDRVARLIEGIKILRLAWSPGAHPFRGRFYQLPDIDVLPKPAGEVPIFIAANPTGDAQAEERVLRRIARHSDGWQTDPIPPELFERRWRRIRELADEEGRSGAIREASIHLMMNICDDRTRGHDETMDFFEKYYGVGPTLPRSRFEAWAFWGPPSFIIDQIGRYLDAGATTPIIRFTSFDQQDQLERFLVEVAPAFAGVARRGAIGPTVAAVRS
jgi:alkanesulfonate monooxygenase SsuD/methylene tetrahydromethanopterin reductase-like flavin-dependent oxidoreductase (luciferase family)